MGGLGGGAGRLRARELERARALCENRVDDGHGAVVFIAGPEASGRSALVQELARTLGDARHLPDVVAGRVIGGQYVALPTPSGRTGKVLAAIRAWFQVAGGAIPVLGAVAQAATVAEATGRAVAPDALDPPPTLAGLREELCRAARERPLAWVLDDCDEVDRQWWSTLLMSLANDIATDLPLFLFMTVRGGEEPTPPREEDSPVLATAHQLVRERGQGEWWPLRAIEPSDVARLTGPADVHLLEHLCDLGEGRAGQIADLWAGWFGAGVVERDTDLAPWRFAPGQPAADMRSLAHVAGRRLAHVFDGDDRRALDAQRILGCAALQGRYFIAEAVAIALREDRGDILDALDDHLEVERAGPHAIVEELESVELTGADARRRPVWRYRFTSQLLRAAAERNAAFGDERTVELCGRLAAALAFLYGDEQARVATQLARLYTAAGKPDEAARARGLVRSLEPESELLERAGLLADQDPALVGAGEARLAATTLIDAAGVLSDLAPWADVEAMAGRAASFARRASDQAVEAHALVVQGIAEMGADNAAARVHLEGSRALYAERGDRSGEARALITLAALERGEDREPRARDLADEALRLARACGDRHRELCSHIGLARIALGRDDTRGTERSLTSARRLRAHSTATERAEIDRVVAMLAHARRQAPRAMWFARRALSLYRSEGNLYGEAGCMLLIGSAAIDSKRWARGREMLNRAAALFEALEELDLEVTARHRLVTLELDADGIDGRALKRATLQLRRLIALYESAGDDAGVLSARLDIGAALDRSGDEAGARVEYEVTTAEAQRRGLYRFAVNGLVGVAATYINRERYEEGGPWLERALELHGEECDERESAPIRHLIGSNAMMLDDYETARRELGIAVELADGHGDELGRDDSLDTLSLVDELERSGIPAREQTYWGFSFGDGFS